MQTTRTLALIVLCVFALCCAKVVLAADNVTDSSGRVWCVRTEVSPSPAAGQEIYLFEEEGAFGKFVTMDEVQDETPHVFLTPAGKIGIVWSRENGATGRMEICSTTYDQESRLWAHPFPILTSPQGDVDHTEPRMEISQSGSVHLVYVVATVEGGRTVSSLIYRIKEGGAWSEPATVSLPEERVAFPELYLGASEQGYPLVLVYLSSQQEDGLVRLGQSTPGQMIKSLEKDGSDPTPWMKMSMHRLPINIP